jgi:hypothetical protein
MIRGDFQASAWLDLQRLHQSQLEKVEAIKAGLRAGSVGIIKLAKLHGVGVGTVQRIKAALTA